MTHTVGMNRFSATRIGLALLATLALFMTFAFTATPVLADGDGSSAACMTDGNADGTADGNSASFTAPAGQVVTGVCIKSGQLHTEVITANGPVPGGCYNVAGINTQTVTVTRLGDGSGCQGISHIDAVTATPTPPPPGGGGGDTGGGGGGTGGGTGGSTGGGGTGGSGTLGSTGTPAPAPTAAPIRAGTLANTAVSIDPLGSTLALIGAIALIVAMGAYTLLRLQSEPRKR